jgi:hypothetical protein
MDDFQTRALKDLRDRHEGEIRRLATSIQEEIGYLIRDLDHQHATPGHYARRVATDAQEIVTRVAALEALGDAVGIFETSDEPAKENGQ